MYGVSLERIPLPDFSTYVLFTFVSAISSIVYVLHDTFYGHHQISHSSLINQSSSIETPIYNFTFTSENLPLIITNVTSRFINDTWCFWSIINLTYCGMVTLAKTCQHVFFGELRDTEHELIREKFWNFVFYKLVFIYGILNVQNLHDLLLWATWSSILGFLHLLTHLTRDRFEFVMQMPSIETINQFRLMLLMCLALACGAILAAISLIVGYYASLHIVLFMLAEVFQLQAVTIHALFRYMIHVYEQRNKYNWHDKAVVLYYGDLIYHVLAHSFDFVHNLHMLFWNNIKVNMTGLVIGMHLQYLYYEVLKRIQRHHRYTNAVKLIEKKFPLLRNTEDNCCICWELLGICRMLPCKHCFHDSCLRGWIEQNTSCPTCRISLEEDATQSATPHTTSVTFNGRSMSSETSTDASVADSMFCSDAKSHSPNITPTANSEIVHSRSFTRLANQIHSMVSTARGGTSSHGAATQSQLKIANEIHNMFPRIPLPVIMEALEENSSDEVVTAILENRLHAPGPHLLTAPMQVELDLRRSEVNNLQLKQWYELLCTEDLQDPADYDSLSTEATPGMTDAEDRRRFGNLKQERESLLKRRKAKLISSARERYLSKFS